MNFRCARCGSDIPIPAEILREVEGATVKCQSCGARYRRRRRPSATTQEGSPTRDSDALTVATGSGPDTGSSLAGDVSAPAAISPRADSDTLATVPPGTRRLARERVSFFPDELVAKRYRILHYLAKGGMGEVYAAEDLELRERVALKTVRSRAAGNLIAIDRFKREIQLARKVTHSNVCRIFDVARHSVGEGAGEDIVFLTMELLPGRTLAQRLRTDGPMSYEEALPLIRQMGAALAAAHRAGIVHRDFKSDNVMLVPSGDDVRAVVTDFGVARGTADRDDVDVRVTSTGDIVGTPAYMAPEQVSGGGITGAADIYALGVVIFEMMTGKMPFVAETPLATAALRLTQPPPSPRRYRPDLDPRWEEAILRCLERDPEQRFDGNAEEIGRFLAREDAASLAEEVEAQREAFEEEKQQAIAKERRRTLAEEEAKQRTAASQRARTQRLRLVLLLMLVLASGYLLVTRVRQQLTEKPFLARFPTGTIEARRAVAVLGFRNVSDNPELAWLSTALAEMFRTELAAGGQLRLIPGENVARMKLELALTEADSLATDSLRRIRSNLGTDFVVLGSYAALPGGSLRLDLRLQDASTGQTLAAVAENGTEAQLFDLVARSGERLRNSLDLDTSGPALSLASILPTSPKAARLYAEGLDQLRRFDPAAARELLGEALAADASNPQLHSALAAALGALGYEEESLEHSRQAYELAADLPDEERLRIEGQYREAAEHWDRATQIYETLWRSFPDNLEYGLRRAAALTAAGRGEEALATVDVLRQLPPPAAEDPRIDLAEAAAAVSLGEFKRQAEAAARAAQKAEGLNAGVLLAQARITEAEALRQLGRSEEARTAVLAARRLYEEIGNRGGRTLAIAEEANILFSSGDYVAALALYEQSRSACREARDQGCVMRAINNIAVVQRNQGELELAKQNYEALLTLARELGSPMAEVSALNNLGAVLFSEGRLTESRRRFDASLELVRRLGRRSIEASALANIGAVLRAQGDLASAKQYYQQALDIRREIGQLPAQAASLNNLATVAHAQGDLDSAQRLLEEALATTTQVDSESLRAETLHNLGEIDADRGLAPRARERFDEARRIRLQLGQKRSLAQCDLALAALALDERTPELAASTASQLASSFERDHATDDETLANLILAAASLEVGDRQKARSAVDRALALAGQSEKQELTLRARIVSARILAAEGQSAEASRQLAAVVAGAQRLGLLELELEATLRLGQVESSTNPAAARDRLSTLEQRARNSGFTALALKASEAVP